MNTKMTITEMLGYSHFLRDLPDVEEALIRAEDNGSVEICQTSRDCTTIDQISFFDDLSGNYVGCIEYNPDAEFFLMKECTCDPLSERKRDLLRIAAALREYAFHNHWCEFRCCRPYNYGSGYELAGGEIEIIAGKAEVHDCFLYEKSSEGEQEKPISPEEALDFVTSQDLSDCTNENTGLLKAVLSDGFNITDWYDGSELFPRLSDDRRCGRIRFDTWQDEELVECCGSRFVIERALQYCKEIGYCGVYQEDYARKYIRDHAREYPGEKFRIISRNFFGTKVKTCETWGR